MKLRLFHLREVGIHQEILRESQVNARGEPRASLYVIVSTDNQFERMLSLLLLIPACLFLPRLGEEES